MTSHFNVKLQLTANLSRFFSLYNLLFKAKPQLQPQLSV